MNVYPLLVLTFLSGSEAAPIDEERALVYFEEARDLSKADGGRLWGVELYGPMLFVDRDSRAVIANHPDKQGRLTRRGDVFRGHLPVSFPVANTAVKWAGVEWTMILWPPPDEPTDRARLLMHECFHRVQNDIGLSSSDPTCSHLDTLSGRYSLQLEWRALIEALTQTRANRQSAIEDALMFRSARHRRFPDGVKLERALEMNEGVAEYTGMRLSGRAGADLRRWAVEKLQEAPNNSTFVRSFAYASGPAYGILLDEGRAAWRKDVTSQTDLGAILAKTVRVSPETIHSSDINERAAAYDDPALWKTESKREQAREKRLAEYRKQFLTGPVLVLPLRQPQVSFDPRELVPLDDIGTVYPGMSVSDKWGSLKVTGGALLLGNWSAIHLSAAGADLGESTNGTGWTLELAKGWSVKPDRKPDRWTVRRGR